MRRGVYTRAELELLRACTANRDTMDDCTMALAGDQQALARCAVILDRARPSRSVA